MGRSTRYTLSYDHSDPDVVAWVLSEGDIMRKLDGRYVLTPADDGLFRTQLELIAEFLDLRWRARERLRHLDFRPAFAELRPGGMVRWRSRTPSGCWRRP